MQELTLGQKVKNFRKRAGLSQLELEVKLGASAGSISRIENDEVNPTKETLIKLIEVLNLNAIDSSSIFGIQLNDGLGVIVKSSRELNKKLNLDYVLTSSVNEIVFELGFLSAFVTLVRGHRLYAHSASDSWAARISLKFLPKAINLLYVDLEKDSENLMVRTVNEKRIFIEADICKYIVPAVSQRIGNIIKRVTGTRSGISLPIILEGKCLGAIYFGKNYIDDFSRETDLLVEFTEHLAIAIGNARKYESLEKKYLELKKKHG